MVLLLSVLVPAPSIGQRTKSSLSAGEQRYAEKGLKDNRYFFYFINSTISNFGTEEEKSLFKQAIQRDILAQMLYMKFLFHDSFVEIRRSQGILIDLYRTSLDRDIEATKKLLHTHAPGVVKSGLDKARLYLRLGYRDMADAKIDMVMADNYREALYSMRLYKYVRAIKKAKHGKRYAFFAALEAGTAAEERKEWGRETFDQLQKRIENLSAEEKDTNLLIHLDNYYRSKGDKSFYDTIWENPNLQDIPEFSEYLNKN